MNAQLKEKRSLLHTRYLYIVHNIHIYMNHFLETTKSLYFLQKEVKEKTTCVNLTCNYSDLYVRTLYGPMKMKRVNEMKRKIN